MEKQAKKPSSRPKNNQDKVIIKGDFNEIMSSVINNAKKKLPKKKA